MERRNKAKIKRTLSLNKNLDKRNTNVKTTDEQSKTSKPSNCQNKRKSGSAQNYESPSKVKFSENKEVPTIFASAPLNNNFIKVSILGKTINCLVDTGSTLSCVQKSLLDTIDKDFIMYGKSDYRKVKGIGGHLTDIIGTATLPIQIGNHLFYQKFHIFDEILHPLLLGVDFLKANNCTLNFESQTIDTEEGVPVINIIEPDFKLGLARPETVIPIRISKVPHPKTVLFEPVNLLTKKKLAGAKSIVKVNNGCGFCKILNPLPTPVHIKPWHVIGRLVSIDIDSIIEMHDENETEQPSVGTAGFSETNETKQKYHKYKETVDDLGITLDESDLTEEQKLKLYAFIATNRKSLQKILHSLDAQMYKNIQ